MDYLSLKIKCQQDLIRYHKKYNRFIIGFMAIIISIGALDYYLNAIFGVGMMAMCTIWYIGIWIENWLEWSDEKEMLKFYDQQDFKEKYQWFLDNLERQRESHKNAETTFKDMAAKLEAEQTKESQQ
jgi:hypothetical protein